MAANLEESDDADGEEKLNNLINDAVLKLVSLQTPVVTAQMKGLLMRPAAVDALLRHLVRPTNLQSCRGHSDSRGGHCR